MHTILGAGGIIANSLAKELVNNNKQVRLVSRNPQLLPGTEIIAADVTDQGQTLRAVLHSSIVYLCVGLPYNYSIWRRSWPPIINNVIEACKATGARLIFFDNVYMYGKVDGWMTEDTPYNPSSRKGDLRARMATQIMSEVRKGNITASIARAADFYGPMADKTSIPNMLVFAKLAKKEKPQWLSNAKTKHSFTYTPDAAKAMYLLGQSEDSWNQVWHLPTAANPLTGEEFIEKAAAEFNIKTSYFTIRPWMVAMGGIFDRTIAELYEMTYQQKFDYLFDSSKFEKAFNFIPTSYEKGIAEVAAHYKEKVFEK
ncbi:MAG: NAD-dependent dehydratase [Bacteroidetes bacterium]|nr:MAG: NAD-dependent dehydratase [Bacteroidota bacterium]